jgi:hypothetical protein
MENDVIQIGFFDKEIVEIEYDQMRYILRRNPIRAEEISNSRNERIKYIEQLIDKKNKGG